FLRQRLLPPLEQQSLPLTQTPHDDQTNRLGLSSRRLYTLYCTCRDEDLPESCPTKGQLPCYPSASAFQIGLRTFVEQPRQKHRTQGHRDRRSLRRCGLPADKDPWSCFLDKARCKQP